MLILMVMVRAEEGVEVGTMVVATAADGGISDNICVRSASDVVHCFVCPTSCNLYYVLETCTTNR